MTYRSPLFPPEVTENASTINKRLTEVQILDDTFNWLRDTYTDKSNEKWELKCIRARPYDVHNNAIIIYYRFWYFDQSKMEYWTESHLAVYLYMKQIQLAIVDLCFFFFQN